MTPLNGEKLIALRKAGRRPSGMVSLNVGNFVIFPGGLTIPDSIPIDRLDMRCIVGLDVTLFSEDWTDRVASIYAKAMEYAEEICVQIVSAGSDIGWWWVKRWPYNDGRIEFNERHWLEVWEESRAKSCAAKNNQAYAQIRQTESDAYAHLMGE